MWDSTAGTCTMLESKAFTQDPSITLGCSQVKLCVLHFLLFFYKSRYTKHIQTLSAFFCRPGNPSPERTPNRWAGLRPGTHQGVDQAGGLVRLSGWPAAHCQEGTFCWAHPRMAVEFWSCVLIQLSLSRWLNMACLSNTVRWKSIYWSWTCVRMRIWKMLSLGISVKRTL